MTLRLDKGLLGVFVIVVAVFCVLMTKSFSTPYLYGIDGPYYQVQVSYILKHGCLKYSDPPLAFYILTLFSLVLGDVVSGIKVGSILIPLLGAFPIYLLVKDITDDLGGLIASTFYVISPFLIRLSFDLIKNAMGLFFLSLTMFFTYKMFKEENIRYSLASCVSLILTGLTHVLDFGLGLVFVLFLTITYFKRKNYVLMPAITGLALLGAGFLYTGVMGGDPYKGVAFLEMLISGTGRRFVPPSGPIVLPIAVGAAGLLTSIASEGLEKRVLMALSLLLIAMNLPINPGSFLWRFDLMTAVLAPPVLGIILGKVNNPLLSVVLTVLLLGLVFPQFIAQLQAIRTSVPPAGIEELKTVLSKIPNDSCVVVPRTGLRYWVETMREDVFRSIDGTPPGCPVVLIVMKGRHHPPVPPQASPLMIGRFIDVYILPPKPT